MLSEKKGLQKEISYINATDLIYRKVLAKKLQIAQFFFFFSPDMKLLHSFLKYYHSQHKYMYIQVKTKCT